MTGPAAPRAAGAARAAGRPRTPATADLAALAARLTPRDRQLCRLLAEHRVLTTDQVAALLFGSPVTARHRLSILARLGVVERFRPLLAYGDGSAPWHYVLGPAGAAVLAADQTPTGDRMGWRRDRALGIAHSQRLGHLVGVNGFFAALAGYARRRPDAALVLWLSERQCAARWGHVVRPDGYGRWQHGPQTVEFFLEYDNGTEPLNRVLAKLHGYAELAAALHPATLAPVLLWLPGPGRETALRAAMGRPPVPVATATARGGTHPAAPVWLPAPQGGPRRPLAALGAP
jgi:DNA-binding CsgD family transcriptional regulator